MPIGSVDERVSEETEDAVEVDAAYQVGRESGIVTWGRRRFIILGMLTRLKVTGFKNLLDIDVSFGPFTCIAGPNGVGKSNLFDAIRFLSALADHDLFAAATAVRGGGKTADVRSLFHRVGDRFTEEMRFEAEMIVPAEGKDDLGQRAKPSITFLRYILALGYRKEDSAGSFGRLEIRNEALEYISLGDARQHLWFKHSAEWRRSVVNGRRTSAFISTEETASGNVIQFHQDRPGKGSGGRPRGILAAELPRTVLSTATNAAESRTAVMARREMQSWRLLQLEPAALREPARFTDPTHLGADGSHLPAALYHLAQESGNPAQKVQSQAGAARVYATISNRLAQLISDVDTVGIDRDVNRELLILQLRDRNGTTHPARSLSDGTLRFLALAVLEQDPETRGLICLEEPENGINPGRIPAMISLLKDLAMDVNLPVAQDNPLRQVIINTHSPGVVRQVADDSLLIAVSDSVRSQGRIAQGARFAWLSDTWRARTWPDQTLVTKGTLAVYLGPADLPQDPPSDWVVSAPKVSRGKNRPVPDRPVSERKDLQSRWDFGTHDAP